MIYFLYLFLIIVPAVQLNNFGKKPARIGTGPFCLISKANYDNVNITSFYLYRKLLKIDALNTLKSQLDAEEQKIFDGVVKSLIEFRDLSQDKKERLRIRVRESNLLFQIREANSKTKNVENLFSFAKEVLNMIDHNVNLKSLDILQINDMINYFEKNHYPGLAITNPNTLLKANISIYDTIFQESSDKKWRLYYFLAVPSYADAECYPAKTEIPEFFETNSYGKRFVNNDNNGKEYQANPYHYRILPHENKWNYFPRAQSSKMDKTNIILLK